MITVGIFGLGRMGELILYDLLINTADFIVMGFESNKTRIEELKEKYSSFFAKKRLSISELDLNETNSQLASLSKTLLENNVAVSFGAIDYKYNLFLSKICINAKSHFLDLGGNPEVVALQQELNESAKKVGVTIIPDCGLAPGLANILTVMKINEFERVNECHIRVGGLPQDPKTSLKYQQVFSIRGLTNEYIEDAITLKNGEISTAPSLTEIEDIDFPEIKGELEAFQTAGGTSSLPKIYKNKIKNLTYKTIRYKGHARLIRFLKEFGLLSQNPYPRNPSINPREVVEYYLEKKLPQSGPDITLVKIMLEGIINKKLAKKEWIIIDKYDDSLSFTSMARMTGFPISILGQMLAKNRITKRGVVPGELVGAHNWFISELARRNIVLQDYCGAFSQSNITSELSEN